MSSTKRILIPLSAGLAGVTFLSGIYFGLMSWAEGFKNAWSLFWYDRWLIIPIILGFGVQVALFSILKFRLFIPASAPGPGGAVVGASGGISTTAMLACCVHHVTDVLPILGLTAAAAFLGRYRLSLMRGSLGITLAGIIVMLFIIFKERRKTMIRTQPVQNAEAI